MISRYRTLGYLLPLLVFFSFSAFGERQQSTPELFVYPQEMKRPVSFLYASGTVTVNVAALSDPDSLPAQATLPNGLQYDVFSNTLEWRGENAFKWTGVLIGLDGEVLNAVLTVRNQMTAGIIFGEETEFQLVPVSGGYHRLVQLDPGTYSECGGSVLAEAVDDSSPFVPMEYEASEFPRGADGNTVIDVLLVYTAEARAAAGGTEQIELILQNAIDFANQSYVNSSVNQEVNLVASGENGYSESGKTSSDMLNEIRSSPAFLSLRDAYGADLVALVTSTLEGNVGGIGFLMTAQNLGSWFAPYAYSVNRLSNLHWTLTHEMGHNMGLNHEPENAGLDPQDATYPYAFGHKVEGVFRTIMSYSCTQVWCPRIQYFSNPNLSYGGEPTGIENERENWWVLNDTAPIVADFRQRPGCGSLTAPGGLDYPSASETGECTVSWDPVEPNAALYTLQRSTSPSFSGATTIYSGSLLFFEEGALAPNSYYYRVRAENCDGASAWAVGSALVVGEASGLGNVEFSTNLPGNQAEQNQSFLLIGNATSGSPVTFEFFSSATPSKPGSPFDTATKGDCSSGCGAMADFTAPSENMTLYFWLDVSSGGDLQQRSLAVQVESEENPPPPDPSADLEVRGPYSVSAAIGEEFDYSIRLTNLGPSAASSVVLIHTVPEGLRFVSSSPSFCSLQGDVVVCNVGSMASGLQSDIEFVFEALLGGTFIPKVTGSAVEVDPVAANNSKTVRVEIGATADLVLSPHTSSQTLQLGEKVGLRFEVKNNGPSASHNVRLTMTLPEGGQVNATDPQCQIGTYLSCNLGTLAEGESETLQLTLTLTEEGIFSSSLSVDGDEADPDEDGNKATVGYIVTKVDRLVFPYSLHAGNPFPKNPYAGVALFNPNNVPTDVEFTAYDDFGQQLDKVMLSELEGRDVIPPLGQTALIPTEIFDLENVSAVITAGKPHPVKLFFMLGDYDLNTLDGVAGPLPESHTLHFPIARSNSKEAVVLFLFNGNPDQGVEATFKLYTGDGALAGETHRSLLGQGSLAETLEQLFGSGEIDGYVKVIADGTVKGFELYSQSKGLSALAAQPPVEGTRLIAPHYFATVGGNTELRVQNLGEKYVNVVVSAYTNDGSLLGSYSFELPRRECFVRNVTEFLPIEAATAEIVTGYLIIEMKGSLLSTPTVSGSVTFTGFEGNTIATLPLVAAGNLKTRFLHVAQSDELNMFTGLAILNPGEDSAEVTIKVYNTAGQLVKEKSLNNLPPGNRVVDLLSSSTFFQPGFQQVGGHIEVVSDVPVVIFALFGDYGGRFLSAIEGQTF